MRTLPQTPNGKVDRKALPVPSGESVASSTAVHVAPSDALEKKVAAIWLEVLKLDTVGTHDNFFDIGGHSLLAVQVHRHLRAAFDRPLALTDIFRFPTIHMLSVHLSNGHVGDATTLSQGQARAAGRRAALSRRRPLKTPVTAQE
jgi:acyl carrier protein